VFCDEWTRSIRPQRLAGDLFQYFRVVESAYHTANGSNHFKSVSLLTVITDRALYGQSAVSFSFNNLFDIHVDGAASK
jgi:hypothetical protein